jgi:hypothetical protein
MSSGSRRGPSEENILAMLERDAARRRLGGSPRVALYAVGGALALSLVGALAWLLHENNNANDVLRLNEQAGVSVAVVPDKPAQAGAPIPAPYPAFSDEPQSNLHPVAATIVDSPEPGAAARSAPAEARPIVTMLAQAESPRASAKPAAADAPRPAAKVADEVPPLVLLSPAEAAKARGGAAPAKEAAAKKVAAREPAPPREAGHGASAARPASTARAATPARDEPRRVAVRERVADSDTASHASRVARPARAGEHARPAAVASTTAKTPGGRNAAQARARKAAAGPETSAAPVDTDVALISAIIMHADGRAQHAVPCASADRKCGGKGADQP